MKTALVIAALLYVASFILGWYMANAQGIFVLELRLGLSNAYAWLHEPFNTISKAIIQSIFPSLFATPQRYALPSQTPSLSRTQTIEIFTVTMVVLFVIGLVYTFAVTTLPGVVPLVGGIIVGFVAVVDGIGFGIRGSGAMTYLEAPPPMPEAFLAVIVPVLLTLVAQILSSTAGFRIAFATFHANLRTPNFKDAWRDDLKVYVLVIVLLGMAAVAEWLGYGIVIPFPY